MSALWLVWGWLAGCVGIWGVAKTVADWRRYHDRGFLLYGIGSAVLCFFCLGLSL